MRRLLPERHFQFEFRINVWVDIFGSYLIGPIILPNSPNTLNAESYFHLLDEVLLGLLENLPLDMLGTICTFNIPIDK